MPCAGPAAPLKHTARHAKRTLDWSSSYGSSGAYTCSRLTMHSVAYSCTSYGGGGGGRRTPRQRQRKGRMRFNLGA